MNELDKIQFSVVIFKQHLGPIQTMLQTNRLTY